MLDQTEVLAMSLLFSFAICHTFSDSWGNTHLTAHCFAIFFAHSDPVQTDNCAVIILLFSSPPYNAVSRHTPKRRHHLFQAKCVEHWSSHFRPKMCVAQLAHWGVLNTLRMEKCFCSVSWSWLFRQGQT